MSSEINLMIQKKLAEYKIPHIVSIPVIRFYEGNYVLASFITYFSSEDIRTGMINRPSAWMLFDLETGDIIEEYQCSKKDFSDAPYGRRYNIRMDNAHKITTSYYKNIFETLDYIREKIILYDEFVQAKYETYLDIIKLKIPQDYKQFYSDLGMSVIHNHFN